MSKKGVKVTGVEEMKKALKQFVAAEQASVRKGLQKAALFIKGESVQIAPIDFGVLRGSAFYSTELDSQGNAVARVGYTAKYAAAVHEMPMTLKGQPRAHFGKTSNRSAFGPMQVIEFGGGSGKGVYWQGGENKFLQKAVNRNTAKIIEIIAKEAKFDSLKTPSSSAIKKDG